MGGFSTTRSIEQGTFIVVKLATDPFEQDGSYRKTESFRGDE